MTENGTKRSIEKAFSSYAITCLRHAQKDYFRKLHRDSSHVIPLDAVTFEVSISFLIHSQEVLQFENANILSQILDNRQFSEQEQKIIYHKYYEDKTDREIAQLLGISRQAVSKSKSKLLVKLKKLIEN
ncbi:sigma-70 family RNA polymerase sigma factor [Paenibacillus jamilae]|uniref:sigma-70 family RNA polymerase sigma factor n=1 Tax=Paenibacillus jamilae TaxID=114136 RepID=UPI003D2C80DB